MSAFLNQRSSSLSSSASEEPFPTVDLMKRNVVVVFSATKPSMSYGIRRNGTRGIGYGSDEESTLKK